VSVSQSGIAGRSAFPERLRAVPDAVRSRPGALADDGADIAEHRGDLVVLGRHELLFHVSDLLRALQQLLDHRDGHLGLFAQQLRHDVVGETDAHRVEEVVDGWLRVHQAPSAGDMG
jgi:hypothetical protein